MNPHPPARLSLLVLCALVLAGCAQPDAATQASTNASPIPIVEARPDTSFGKVSTGPVAPPDMNATTAAAPRLVPGEWWRIRFEGGVFAGAQLPELVRVVAQAGPDGYVMGMPHEGWFKEAIIMHAPAFGDVRPDLSFDAHNKRFEPVRFPLVAGETWQTVFGGGNLTARVESADDHTATIRFDPPPSPAKPTDPFYAALAALSPLDTSGAMRMTYDARQHEIVKMEASFGSWEVVEHGYGFTGWVTVPRAEHTAIDYGQFLAATPGEPVVTRSIEVAGGFNRMTIVQAIIAFGPGAYRVRDVSPNGTEYVTDSIAGQALTMKFFETADPDGKWTAQDVVGGPGATYTMGMAYHQYDIRLPDGAIRTDHAHPVIR